MVPLKTSFGLRGIIIHNGGHILTMAQQVLKVVVKGRLLTTIETRNVFYWGMDSTETVQSDADAVADTLDEALSTLLPVLNEAWTCYGYDFYRLNEGWFEPFYAISKALQGEEVVDMTSFQTAVLATMKTSVKKMIGRKFFPGIDELFTGDGSIMGDAVTAFGAALVALMTPVDNSNKRWYWGTTGKGSVFAPFTSATVGSILSTMRRRKPGYGI
jgi:hypothetical protein